MKIIKQCWRWHSVPVSYKQMIESVSMAARNCYQSGIKDYSLEEKFIKALINRGHLSPLEHVNFSIKFTTDRGVMAELTRHRLASFSVESTRYVKYKEIRFIEPYWAGEQGLFADDIWLRACENSESDYKGLLDMGLQPQQARCVLNNSMAVDIVMTCNLRELRHILKLRTAKDAHPQMAKLMISLLETLKRDYPIFFEDIL